jgi:Lon protease-like protein
MDHAMLPKSPFTQPFEKLPPTLPVFPLDNALLPGGELPLEFFEPRYLNLVEDAIRSDQLIGMVQPRDKREEPALHSVGCAGRIRQYRERKSGRIDVMLSGVCRYRIVEEIPTMRGYRLVRVDWSDYAHDYEAERADPERITRFNQTLRSYFERNNMAFDWSVMNKLEIEEVVNNLVLLLKLTTDQKQRLLESSTLNDRLDVFGGFLQPQEVAAKR